MRIYEFAKLHNIANKDILAFLKEQGIDCKNHMGVVTSEMLTLLEKKYKQSVALLNTEKKESIQTPHLSSPELSNSSLSKEKLSMENNNSRIKKTASLPTPPEKTFFQKPVSTASHDLRGVENPLIIRPLTVGDLAHKLGKMVSQVIMTLLKQGTVCTKNHLLSEEQVAMLADVYEVPTVKSSLNKQASTATDSLRVAKAGTERLPVVVVMGHVDHGKTTLLDYIRKTRVVAREKGGITQHLGAYEAHTPQGNIVFLDTPGHEAFSKVRRRGAFIADLAVLVVAADDGIMPQTVECIKALKTLEIPIIVAINKMDKVEPTRLQVIMRQLSQYDLLTEEWGGSVICVPISAKEGTGVDRLLEMIVLQSQMMELQADRDVKAQGYVLESKVEKGRGVVATVICRHGTLHVGDFFSVGDTFGKVTVLKDSAGVLQQEMGPSLPVLVTGFDTLPTVGTLFQVIEEKEYRRAKSLREENPAAASRRSSTSSKTAAGVLNLLVKAEGSASLEALLEGIEKLSKSAEKPFFIIHSGIGAVTENDVMLAEGAHAYILGFGVKAEHSAALYGRKTKTEIHLFDIIYRVFEDLEKYSKKHETVKKITTKIGEANVIKVFVVKKLGTVAGAYIREGKFSEKGTVIIYRGKKVVGQGKIKSLQRDKKTVKEVHTGFECAFLIDGFEDWQVDDRVECFLETSVA